MKLSYLAIGAVLIFAGCNQDNTDKSAGASATNAISRAKEDLGQERDKFLAAMDQKRKDLDTEIDALSQKVSNLKDDAKTEANKALASLRDERDVVSKKYEQLKNAGADAWDKTKSAFQSAWDDLVVATDKLKAKFNN